MGKKTKQKRFQIPPFEGAFRLGVIILIFALGLLLFLASINLAGVIGNAVFSASYEVFGILAYLLPLFIIFCGMMIIKDDFSFPIKTTLGISLILFSVLSLLGIFSHSLGGYLGLYFGNFFSDFFGILGALVLLGTLLFLGIIVSVKKETLLYIFEKITQGTLSLKSDLFSKQAKKEEEFEDEAPLLKTKKEHPEEIEEEVFEEERADPEVRMFNDTLVSKQKNKEVKTLAHFHGTYQAPPVSLLGGDSGKPGVGDIKANANIIKRTFQNFGISVEMDEVSVGPTVTRYAIKPAEGVRLSRIISLQNNLELALAAHPVRIEAPIPGKSLVGIEVPNASKATVGLGGVLSAPEWIASQKPLLAAVGRDITGTPHYVNVAKMPHGLIAGATGSGKSVAIHALITSLLYRNGPQDLRFIMVDPKRVELTLYNGIPHLLTPVITDSKKCIMALKWAAKEMDRRYNVLESEAVRDIESYHKTVVNAKNKEDEEPEAMPYIVIVIDELADIMQTYPRELEAGIVRLAQMSRAVGIHLLLSTQRPSVNVITGLIKANVPTRMALQVASQIDSRTILDSAGAETLLGAGDMLYQGADMQKPVRIQTAYIAETEVKKIVEYIKKNNAGDLQSLNLENGNGESHEPNDVIMLTEDADVDDDLYEEAKAAVMEAGKASTSYLQRKLRIGYSRAARLMDLLHEKGIIGAADGARPREVLTGAQAGEQRKEDDDENL